MCLFYEFRYILVNTKNANNIAVVIDLNKKKKINKNKNKSNMQRNLKGVSLGLHCMWASPHNVIGTNFCIKQTSSKQFSNV